MKYAQARTIILCVVLMVVAAPAIIGKLILSMNTAFKTSRLIALSLLFLITQAHAGQITLAWDASASVAGYQLYYGESSKNYTSGKIDVGNKTSYTVLNLADGKTFYFAATAYDSSRTESVFSNEVSATVPVTQPPSSGSSYSIFNAAAAPVNANEQDNAAVNIGVKFSANQSGYITGIRFYKSTRNKGTHVATLWNSAGTRLAEATVANESAAGWQQVNFTAPILIAANTVYVASYHTNVGHYANDNNYFATAIDNGPLHALHNGENGNNGVYAYGSNVAFPTTGYRATNYWVDVVFMPAK